LGQKRSADQLAFELVKEKLASADLVEWGKDSRNGPNEHAGYFKDTPNGRTYVVHAAAFRKWFDDDPRLHQAALVWLRSHKFLTAKATNKQQSDNSTDWAVTTPKWPNGKSLRSIEVRSLSRPPFPMQF